MPLNGAVVASPTVSHRLIIVDPSDRVLAVETGDGARLPYVDTEDRHTADTDYLNAAVLARWGLRCTVLQSLYHSAEADGRIERVHELELHESTTLQRWVTVDLLRDEADRDAIRRWQAARARGVVDGRAWTQHGWFRTVRAWLDGAMTDCNAGRVREIVQLRAWPSSTVLKVIADHKSAYCKALPESVAAEGHVTAYLSQHLTGFVPTVLAFDPQRRWLLTEAFEGRPLELVDEIAAWERAASRYGALQVASVPHVAALTREGCLERTLADLAGSIRPLLDDPEMIAALDLAERNRLRAAAGDLVDRCAELAATPLPRTLEHGDLWPGNVLVDATASVIIDWEDAAIAHPLLGLAPLYVGMSWQSFATGDALQRMERAYIDAFRGYASPEALADALRVARPLAFIDMARRYRKQRASVTSQHPWMRELVAEALRRALAWL
jgi:Phosphotransferase enzyme family